ncbi:hypothetical protein HLB44_32605 [Aquincola sp. S2]|uniref:Integral membrane protein n=1 Tax=Pseudaquabacterium terrae TaxID=2732868 RepID=A0ABX2ET06_9BURK|nr:hypothetical protein [Aquabacterium terrae]NRF71738.1 hypothetical protein [Aquabacterium terrae]
MSNPINPAAEALSAFFVGLLYFLAQWMWQMANAKSGAALPVAYVLFIGTAVSGAGSFHALLMYGEWPPGRMRVVNALLFSPFLVVGLASYERARIALSPSASAWYEHWAFVIAVGVVIGFVPLAASYAIARSRTSKSIDTSH